ncbi:DUF1212-domain-containing protein [Artomyces pyxidatus]|uniref:DUF1212-domain-containing protein n=1 Tax=Artomyces pyxidatus TaxID=48021 RepID=A0ACB8SY31_9AGAM|nr:DUF1212-domain-containing protein [Artomyces pyxidatus]
MDSHISGAMELLGGVVTGRPWLTRQREELQKDNEALDGYEPDDPIITGTKLANLEDPDDVDCHVRETMKIKYMSYKERRKAGQKIKIEYNITSVLNRQKFICTLARALLAFGAPSHRVESQLVSAARILELDAEFAQLPNILLVSFGDPDLNTSESHFIQCNGHLALGKLRDVHTIYRQVVHDELSAKKATRKLENLLNEPPIYGVWMQSILAFLLSVFICPIAFGGSFLDMWIAGAGAFILRALQATVVHRSARFAKVFEITIAMFVSFVACALGSIDTQIFCYGAISSGAIVGILPGYLILSSSLELASKNILCGSVKMIYALIYTLFLGFGLQVGSDLYLLLDFDSRNRLKMLAKAMTHTVIYTGKYVLEHSDDPNIPLSGTFAFINGTVTHRDDFINGCYRPASFPWFLQPLPFWTHFLLVPAFSIVVSLANYQPWKSLDLLVMVVISCAAYVGNKAAEHFIFGQLDIVSAIGAAVVGVLGNLYSRRFGGTAFTSMVTGVLFLPGGVDLTDTGLALGESIISVSIDITVGLFTSPAIVYMFVTRKNAAMFSF